MRLGLPHFGGEVRQAADGSTWGVAEKLSATVLSQCAPGRRRLWRAWCADSPPTVIACNSANVPCSTLHSASLDPTFVNVTE
jgi:hypothetical protein